MSGELRVLAPDGVPEVREGDDLAAMVAAALDLKDGDVVLVTSKVVSKAEGRLYAGDREAALVAETVRVVATTGATRIVRNHLGITLAAAGIDESHIAPGWFALLPKDPDASARALRVALASITGHNVAVVVTDTAGRAWRVGQTDLAIGAAGLNVVEDLRGARDHFGTPLRVTLPAVADELANAAELAAGKLSGRPFVRVRGRSDLVLAPGTHGPGAASLVRVPAADLFGYGARAAVVAAVRGGDPTPFGAPATAGDLASLLPELTAAAVVDVVEDEIRVRVPLGEEKLLVALVLAHGWVPAHDDSAAGRECRSFVPFSS